MFQHHLYSLILAFAVVSGLACSPAQSKPLETPKAPGNAFIFAFLVRPKAMVERSEEDRAATQAAHLANINRLAEEKKLLVAGPFGDKNPHPEARGIFVFDTADQAVARTWTNSDPAVQAGVLEMELGEFHSSSPMRRVFEFDKQMRDELRRAGQEPKMETTIRGFVMLLGRDVKKAEKALEPLRIAGKVLFEGRLDGSTRARYVAVLDSETVEAAGTLLGAEKAELGEYELVSWWSTRALTGLATSREKPPSAVKMSTESP